MFELTGYMSQV